MHGSFFRAPNNAHLSRTPQATGIRLRYDPLYEISKLFEASDRAGQVLWNPEVDTGEPAPDAVVFFQEHCRLAVTFVPSICAIEGKNWKAMDSSGGVDLKSPIDQAWRAGESVRKTIKKCIGIGAHVIPVVVFLNMAENDDIKASLGRSQVKLVWQIEELVERCAALPEEHQLQPQLNADFIEEETLALGWPPAKASPAAPAAAAERPADLGLSGRAVVMRDVQSVVINIFLPGDASSPPSEA